jgi:hypothetical protein
MRSANPILNIPQYHKKGLMVLTPQKSIQANFYFVTTEVAEGTPLLDDATADFQLKAAVAGQTHGAKVRGLALQLTYDDSKLGELAGYHFANNTKQRLDGQPIGVLMGQGWALTNNYWGQVNFGDQASVGASGKLVVSGVSGDKLPIYFEGSGLNGSTMVQIRFDFPLDRH